jgi:ATP-dependent DNA helicase RecQ
LRSLRRQLALESHVPPYIVFSDRALIEMAAQLPRTDAQFLAINGVGQAKLAKYGAPFLQLIANYCSAGGLPAGADPAPDSPAALIRPVIRRRFHEVGELFAQGQSIAELAGRYGVAPQTIVQHLVTFVQSGQALDPDRVLAQSSLPPAQRDAVLSAFDRLGLERLGPVHEAFSGAIPYEELHLLRLYRMAARPG